MTPTVVHLRIEAPCKPASGAPCNGCGVCCALEPCPVGAIASVRLSGPCRLLHWSETQGRYRCGALTAPQRWPAGLSSIAQSVVSRWIAAGNGCDCTVDATPTQPESRSAKA